MIARRSPVPLETMRGPGRWAAGRSVSVKPLAQVDRSVRLRYVRTIWRWERSEYGAEQGRSAAAIKGWGHRRAGGLLCAVRRGRLLGYADLMPLAAAHYRCLRLGLITEERLPAHWTTRTPRTGTSYWYVASLIVSRDLRRSEPGSAHCVSRELQRGIYTLIARCSAYPARILGISATAVGRAKFLQTGFEPVACAVDAVDLRPRFERTIQRPGQLRDMLDA
jgi:hypothetical protein